MSRQRADLLREHAEAVLKAESQHRLAWNALLDPEMHPMVRDGMPPHIAELAATNNLAVKKENFDLCLMLELLGLQRDLRKKLRQLVVGE
jgi:hypothetical protein